VAAAPPGTKPAMLYTKPARGLNKGRTSLRTVAISGAINVKASVKGSSLAWIPHRIKIAGKRE
jgi:hypothetical protein